MGRKIKLTMCVLIFLMMIGSQHVYANAIQKGELPDTAEPEIKGYTLSYADPDGENGYYHALPEITLCSQDENCVTKYTMIFPSGNVEQGMLTGTEKTCWEARNEEGTYCLNIEMYMKPECGEDEEIAEDKQIEGNEEVTEDIPMKEWKKSVSWNVDATGPNIQMISPEEAEVWYQAGVTVSAKASDSGSGVEIFSGGTGSHIFYSENNSELSFLTEGYSSNNQPLGINLCAKDRAGNRTEKKLGIFIDGKAPELMINGIENYSITSKNQTMEIVAKEENSYQKLEMLLTCEDAEGQIRKLESPQWEEKEGTKYILLDLQEEGIYKMNLSAVDKAGNTSMETKQIIIDKSSPIIGNVEKFNQLFLQKFQWDYDKEPMLTDFTNCSCQVKLDGQIYPSGELIVQEGRHRIQVEAKDAAGNTSQAQSEFFIDRTPPVISFFQIIENGKNVKIKNQDQFEEEICLVLEAENPADEIRQVLINGKAQKKEGNAYQYTFQEKRPYEIVVYAVDKAGNQTKETLGIQVVARKNLFDKVKMAVTGEKKQIKSAAQSTGSKADNFIISGWIVSFAGIFLLSIVSLTIQWRRKKSRKREDAG